MRGWLHLVPHPAVLEFFAWCKGRSPRWFLEKRGECEDGTIEYDYYIVAGAVKTKVCKPPYLLWQVHASYH